VQTVPELKYAEATDLQDWVQLVFKYDPEYVNAALRLSIEWWQKEPYVNVVFSSVPLWHGPGSTGEVFFTKSYHISDLSEMFEDIKREFAEELPHIKSVAIDVNEVQRDESERLRKLVDLGDEDAAARLATHQSRAQEMDKPEQIKRSIEKSLSDVLKRDRFAQEEINRHVPGFSWEFEAKPAGESDKVFDLHFSYFSNGEFENSVWYRILISQFAQSPTNMRRWSKQYASEILTWLLDEIREKKGLMEGDSGYRKLNNHAVRNLARLSFRKLKQYGFEEVDESLLDNIPKKKTHVQYKNQEGDVFIDIVYNHNPSEQYPDYYSISIQYDDGYSAVQELFRSSGDQTKREFDSDIKQALQIMKQIYGGEGYGQA
jgi:hypothetical protein